MLTPNGGEQLTVGQSYAIRWQTSPGIVNYLIYLVNSLGQESLINGASAPNTSYTWMVNSPIMQNTGLHKIKIVDAAQGGVGSATQDLSDKFFTINSPITTPTPISVTPTPTVSPSPTTTSAPTVTVTTSPTLVTPTPTAKVTPTPTPQPWWYRFFRPTPTPTRTTPPMGIQ
ncbi:MAG TPA: Ser-Thr-rich GPI-anchored membrane family protein [Patescibacteria group bacterium]|nr:Ser-Thr-rich GPI-anchored membrane family protein [Patescibacteria group bacterium]